MAIPYHRETTDVHTMKNTSVDRSSFFRVLDFASESMTGESSTKVVNKYKNSKVLPHNDQIQTIKPSNKATVCAAEQQGLQVMLHWTFLLFRKTAWRLQSPKVQVQYEYEYDCRMAPKKHPPETYKISSFRYLIKKTHHQYQHTTFGQVISLLVFLFFNFRQDFLQPANAHSLPQSWPLGSMNIVPCRTSFP